ncbi:MAG: glycerol-3-phosphate dehydrogenase/oxidase [Myxococcota bacterium]|nr:glycerol-3-phosphate dehydrogenase/oxidase [Myxococcota bacterium]
MLLPPWKPAASTARGLSAGWPNGISDVLVVGGGITGAGVALDAASRGLRTALVERDDFASGTSSKSSKMVHGGLRYLEQGDFRLVYEALRERQRLRRNAPHLVTTLPFLIPLFKKSGMINHRIARALGLAMWIYDLTGGYRIGKLHRRLSRDQAVAHMPVLHRERIAGAYLYYDARADDARLTLAVVRTAALDHGAVVANRTSLVGLDKDATGRTTRARLRADGQEFFVRARVVVNAAGVWSDDVRGLDETPRPDSIRPAKGIHIVVPWSKLRNDIAVSVPGAGGKRSICAVPWGDYSFVGTTDTDYDGPLDDPQCTPEDVDYLLASLNASITETVTRDDVLGTWAGLRPLLKQANTNRTVDLSRRHKVSVSGSGVLSITGGKLTTYRQMAEDTVDEAVRRLEAPSRRRHRSRTRRLRLRGAEGFTDAQRYDRLPAETVTHLTNRYGGEARVLFDLIQKQPDLGEPLVPGLPYLRAEAIHGVRHEMATSLDDLLSRRTRARLLARDASAAAAERVADLVAKELGWSKERQQAEVASFRAACELERQAAGLARTPCP